jgi:hypothetical protein
MSKPFLSPHGSVKPFLFSATATIFFFIFIYGLKSSQIRDQAIIVSLLSMPETMLTNPTISRDWFYART